MYQQPQSYQNRSQGPRPLGITIIAVVLSLGAIFGILSGAGSIVGGPFAIFGTGIGGFFTKEIEGVIGIILAAAQLWVAYGLFTLKPWSFWVTVAVEVLGVLHTCSAFSHGIGLGACSGLLPLLILGYMFLDGNVRRAFRT